ncbi:MAG: glutaminyl-peptide cyclotransferase [Bacteroidales bacterium]|nr:glutaminyl-peptide cyclotransferase [Bacteroidales bacterium]MDD4673000.1 glutaminyl-peptide cyclotransferase [Bacteroidales bacterium]MDY0348372.1 glutaminyl-peptide cyclotransferase [Tenuifilaceae bacterium]
MKTVQIIVIVAFELLFNACNSSKTNSTTTQKTQKTKRISLVKVIEPSNGELFTQGEPVNFTIKHINDTIIPDSVILFINNNRIGATKTLSKSFETRSLRLGKHQLKATAWLNGHRQTASVGIKLKANAPPKQYGYSIVNTFPHDIEAYTQGLFYHKEHLIESTGQIGMSSLRQVEIETGKIIQSVNLERQYFGEGTTIYDNEIYQITWTSRKGFVYEPETFNLIRTFDYPTQGWGLTTIEDKLVMSDGSNTLYFLEPKSFAEISRIEVYNHVGPVNQLNELEYIDGKIYANVYLTDLIVIINPETGMVEAEVDLSNLLNPSDRHRNIDVLNGIAWDKQNSRLFVTGKNWPKLFEITIKRQ